MIPKPDTDKDCRPLAIALFDPRAHFSFGNLDELTGEKSYTLAFGSRD